MKSGEDAVAALLDVLNREGVPYMIVGSFSSNRYGVPRATHDADFVVGTKGIQWTKYLAELPEGFELDPQASFDWPYIEEWCEKHETLDLLAEAKAEAAYAWEDE
jgi:predicted nucleotidyltransferase